MQSKAIVPWNVRPTPQRRTAWIGLCVVLILLLSIGGGRVTVAHSPGVDACTCDWCFFDTVRDPDTSAVLECELKEVTEPYPDCTCVDAGTTGQEVAWYDAEADNLVVNDMANIATTSDMDRLYFAAALFNDPDPASIPSGQVAIDFLPGGNSEWLDVEGSCSVSGADCTTNPMGCPNMEDVCVVGKLDNPNIGLNSTPVVEAEYLIVFDFALFVLGGGVTVGPYGQLREATTTPGEWTLIKSLDVAVDPGLLGTTGGPPGKVEVAVDWVDFACEAGCPEFGPDDGFRVSFMIAEGDTSSPFFTPGGPIEDLMSEEVGGTYTTTNNSCPIGAGTTDCELADGSADAFMGAGSPSGRVPNGTEAMSSPMTVAKAGGDLTLSWDPSCRAGADDDDYEIYEGTIGDFASHQPLLCTTGGNTEETFTPSEGDTYYLVVPTNSSTEGSYGPDSDGNERPLGPSACKVQVIGDCP